MPGCGATEGGSIKEQTCSIFANKIIMIRLTPIFCLLLVICSCAQKQPADALFYNGRIQTVDSVFNESEAFVVKDGKIVELGTQKELLNKYKADTQVNLNGQYVYPGLIDAHCHFYGLGLFMQRVDLTGAKDFKEAVSLCMKFYARQQKNYLLGRGWDQNKWPDKAFPTNEELNHAFPDVPVLLKRIDGHAAIANDYALNLAHLNIQTKIDGGELLQQNGKLTGLLIDNAVDLVENVMPKPSLKEKIKALMEAQATCFEFGLTSVQDAGLDPDLIELIDSLQTLGLLKIRVNAMVSLTPANLEYYLKKGIIIKDRLQVNSFKMYGDGSLGSRGACLLKPYYDLPEHTGFLLTSIPDMELYVNKLANSRFQLNTHAIGDSTNRVLLELIAKAGIKMKDRRWRIEHAQVVDPIDRIRFGALGIVPSVQPTHATSDMYWAEERLGAARLQNAYAYKSLLNQLGWLPLGTDFPVEAVSPFYTFDAAVSRKDANGFPLIGFQIKEALTREEALKGMTLWAAMAAFEEGKKGSLTTGKFADFIVLDVNLMKDDLHKIRNAKPLAVYLNGERVK